MTAISPVALVAVTDAVIWEFSVKTILSDVSKSLLSSFWLLDNEIEKESKVARQMGGCDIFPDFLANYAFLDKLTSI